MDILEFGPFDPAAQYRLRPGGYVIVIDEADRVAVLRGKAGVFLPGGGQDEGESPEDAAIREAREEAGFRVVLASCVGVADELVFAGAPWGHFRKRCTFFSAELASGSEIAPTTESEGRLEWIEAAVAVDRLSHASQRWALLRHLDRRSPIGGESRFDLDVVRRSTWQQLGAAIDALDSMIEVCPDHVWGASREEPWFWAMAFHTAFFLDYNFAQDAAAFHPPAPFTLDELDPAGVLPDRTYSRSEIRAYLAYLRERARLRLVGPSAKWFESEHACCNFTGTGFEIALYTMRHVQHHTAQLAGLLRRAGIEAPRWKKRAADPARASEA